MAHDFPPDVPEHLRTWHAYEARMMWTDVLRKGGPHSDTAQRALDELPPVSALDALAANAAAVDVLIRRRWYVIQDAREAGATWKAIGEALGITKQGAQDYYRRQIADQEQYAAQFHDADRARAVLNEDLDR